MAASGPPGERDLDLVAIGECMVELWAEEPLGSAATLRRSFGGDVLNALVMASRLGARTAFMTHVGDDPFGASLLAAWRSEGVDVSACPLVPGVNGVYFISLRPGGEREFSYRRARSAATTLTAASVDDALLLRARALLLSGITQAISPSAQEATLDAARRAREAGVLVAFDPNYREALWRDRALGDGQAPDDGPRLAAQAADELIPCVDVALPSQPADVTPFGLDEGASADTLADAVGFGGPGIVALKLGAAGALVRYGGERRRVPADAVPAVDATGAGDAWNAAFLLALIRGAGPPEAAAMANTVAAWKLGHRGAVPTERPPAELAQRFQSAT